MSLIQCKRTVITQDEAKSALSSALNDAGVDSLQALSLIAAHSAFETGRWKAMYNYNFGNIGATKTSDSFRLEDCGINTPPGNPVYFAAYASIDDGAKAMVSLISRRYREAWDILVGPNPDPYKYVARLKEENYFTADERLYANGVASIYREYALASGVPYAPKV